MEIAHWSDKYETGFPIIDKQHQKMFALVNQLNQAMVEQADQTTLKQLLRELLNDTIEHFTLEEDLMKEHDYPSYEQHKQIHDRLTHKVRKVLHCLESNEDPTLINSELSHFLHQWLVHHIQGQDRKMIQFFRERNIGEAHALENLQTRSLQIANQE
ncbi:MAG: hemerythrin [Cyanobacteria bacterium SW_9_44_58]|nr:MAG: hemerythrin [Cyanobacteria bacterium SW_9_44_58]